MQRPEPLVLSKITWVVSPEGFFCLDGKNYELIAKNNAEILRWIKEASWQLDYYRKD